MFTTILALALITQKAPQDNYKPQPIDRAALEERLKADPYYEPAEDYRPSPGDIKPVPKPSKKARYRAYNKRYEAEQAELDRQQRAYEAKMAPIWAAQQARQQELQLRMYEAELRHRDNLDFNDAVRGITRPR